MQSIKLEVKSFLLIITLTFSFLSKIGTWEIPNTWAYIVMIPWIMIAVYKIMISKNNWQKVCFTVFLKGNFILRVIIYLYTVLLIYLGLTEERFFSTNIQTFVNGLSTISIFYLYREKTFKYSVIALISAYSISVFCTVITGTMFFEYHDLAFATGFLIIYFFFGKKTLLKKDIKWFLLAMIITILAFKRIEMVALAGVIAIHFLYHAAGMKGKKMMMNIIKIAFIIVIYLYIMLIENSSIWTYVNDLGIYVAGRNYYYDVFANITDFSPSFIGLGRNSMSVLFRNDYAYMHVGNIHSDILRMYAECGFWLFAVWLINYFIYFPKLLKNVFGTKVQQIFLLCTFYIFMTYFTDNTELYIVTQYFYMLIPLCVIQSEIKNKNLTEEKILMNYRHTKYISIVYRK